MLRTKRAKYLLYICLHVGAVMLAVLFLRQQGYALLDNGLIHLVILLVTPLAAAAYLGSIKLVDLFKEWQYRRGRDVYSEEAYEDDAGFLHINRAAARINQEEVGLMNVLTDLSDIPKEVNRSD